MIKCLYLNDQRSRRLQMMFTLSRLADRLPSYKMRPRFGGVSLKGLTLPEVLLRTLIPVVITGLISGISSSEFNSSPEWQLKAGKSSSSLKEVCLEFIGKV